MKVSIHRSVVRPSEECKLLDIFFSKFAILDDLWVLFLGGGGHEATKWSQVVVVVV